MSADLWWIIPVVGIIIILSVSVGIIVHDQGERRGQSENWFISQIDSYDCENMKDSLIYHELYVKEKDVIFKTSPRTFDHIQERIKLCGDEHEP